jgi:hypothetical protein
MRGEPLGLARHSRPKDSVASLADDPGIHEAARDTRLYRLYSLPLIMDCWVKPGKDEREARCDTRRLLQVMWEMRYRP